MTEQSGQPGEYAEPAEVEEIDKGVIFVPAADIRRLYTCIDCGEEYISVSALGQHRIRDHTNRAQP